MNIIIYTGRVCPFSQQVVDDMKSQNVDFIHKKVDEDPEALLEMYKLTKKIATPVITIEKDDQKYTLLGYTQENKKTLQKIVELAKQSKQL
ncbi:hypothetical protein A3H80_01480 [Candidatus Roizmanbacteria bacterium RIFCSPLOWO2_02_FULL_37_19]|uniref:Glutaredoxin domain-containing protein n=1 Tax=Candidatus Roizmanbacteria bacterium RIFCSPHIGHO2_02_FULL_37_24 TaxID=1802037 RepID=A0A1F7GVQ7_9BACT|nr:MAG: hypothetical protein A2862_01500 [Candidatus Roizmanbacteria bacterium RIFCSPHIGHO2_01_FULL_38_41]OGK22991.1 MAG: hypothetical protein A3C24_02525 [Candidatus Roizmanbacteria bacterium RIFCSPHIGHO2_02_FULL_37_24]OGK32228.1 MAG: hypothetical protein A3E10_02200 [Candidatus Roizmanbacteria bacterium RIFCSPHIGHO2_12_FULL_37_23]OGK45656.1 MAG: hypothetical protein A2956_00700 [Candidatus Roizmanbacteria bacterium RIFCSPLOWO2_01_FULL_37_57]OGK53861.1 MAG: hypothetical protein A3H80_01480 [Ca